MLLQRFGTSMKQLPRSDDIPLQGHPFLYLDGAVTVAKEGHTKSLQELDNMIILYYN